MSKQIDEEVMGILAAVAHIGGRGAKLRATLLAVATAVANGRAIDSAFNPPQTHGRQGYYRLLSGPHGVIVRATVKRLTALLEARIVAEKLAADKAEREKRHRDRVVLIDSGKKKLGEALIALDFEKELPPLASVVSLFKTVLDQERAEFGESEPTLVVTADAQDLAEKANETRQTMAAKLALIRQAAQARLEAVDEDDTGD